MKEKRTLKKNLIIGFVFLFIVLLLSHLIVKELFIFPETQRLQNEVNENKFLIIQKQVESVENYLEFIASDHAFWDDTYLFMEGLNVEYPEEIFSIETLEGFNIHSAKFFTSENDLFFERSFDNNYDKEITFKFLEPNFQNTILISKKEFSKGITSKKGIIKTNNGILIYASIAITHTNEKGPYIGTLFFGKLVNQDLANEIEENTGYNIDLILNKNIGDDEISSENNGVGEKIFYLNFKDSFSEDAFSLKLNLKQTLVNEFHIFSTDNIILFTFLLILILIFFAFVNCSIIQPINRLNKHIINLRKTGNFKKISLKNQKNKETQNLISSFNELVSVINIQKKEINDKNIGLQKKADIDHLTKLFNKQYLYSKFKELTKDKRFTSKPCSVIMLDIDFYKKYNDSYGHKKGDDVLSEFAKILSNITRKKYEDIVARYGGEEFTIFLHNITKKQTKEIISRIQLVLKQKKIPHKGSEISKYLTVSAGFVYLKQIRGHSLKKLIIMADKALYKAKENGRNTFEEYKL